MSNIVQGYVYNNAPYEDDRFKVLLALADQSNDDGYAYMSMIKLARKARVSYRNAIRVVKRLEKEKIESETMMKVVRHRQKGMANDYYINVSLLASLPYFWPEHLLDVNKNRVTRCHPKVMDEVVEEPVENSDSLGDIVENLGCHQNENRVTSRVTPCHPIHVMSSMTNTSHDHGHPVSHDDGQTVENFSQQVLPELGAAVSGRDYPGGPLPKGGRFVRDESDPGGWNSLEVMEAFREMVPKTPSRADRDNLEIIGRLGFSTELTIYLMQAAKGKAKEPPGSMSYFRVALERLRVDCEMAIKKAEPETVGMSKGQSFWFLNQTVLREIAMWERWLGRS